MDHHHLGSRVFQDDLQAIDGVRRIERDVGAAGLDGRQHRHQLAGPAGERDADGAVAPDPRRDETLRELIGQPIQLRIREGRVGTHHGRMMGTTRHTPRDHVDEIGGISPRIAPAHSGQG